MKSILVIDTPKNCPDCQLMVDGWCYGKHYADVYGELEKDKRPTWCPLKSLPQRKETDGTEPFEIFMHREGWNQCLDEIMGETE